MFPASTTPLAASSTPYPARQVLAEGKGFSVLVVEDQASMRASLVSELRRARVSDIFEAPDGGAALHLFRARRPDLVLLDIQRRGKDDHWVAQQMRVSESSDWPPDRLPLRHSQRAACVARGMTLRADQALYAAKVRGRNRFFGFEMQMDTLEQLPN